jgi:hypothetical protein
MMIAPQYTYDSPATAVAIRLQATLSPGKVVVMDNATYPVKVNVTLSKQPSDTVTVTVAVPGAWDGTPMAIVEPSEIVFTPNSWNQTRVLTLQPRPVCDGDYFVKLNLQ